MIVFAVVAVLSHVYPLDFSEKAPGKSDGGDMTTTEVTPEASTEDVEKVLAELDELGGLEGVKAEVRKLVNLRVSSPALSRPAVLQS